ncbi:hypothetical protein MY8738_007693 [Beauveria namnaoensis]
MGKRKSSRKPMGPKKACIVHQAHLSAAVDVYGEWVDAAEAVAKEDGAHASYTGTAQAPPARRNSDHDEATSDRDESHRYGGDGIVADDEDD